MLGDSNTTNDNVRRPYYHPLSPLVPTFRISASAAIPRRLTHAGIGLPLASRELIQSILLQRVLALCVIRCVGPLETASLSKIVGTRPPPITLIIPCIRRGAFRRLVPTGYRQSLPSFKLCVRQEKVFLSAITYCRPLGSLVTRPCRGVRARATPVPQALVPCRQARVPVGLHPTNVL